MSMSSSHLPETFNPIKVLFYYLRIWAQSSESFLSILLRFYFTWTARMCSQRWTCTFNPIKVLFYSCSLRHRSCSPRAFNPIKVLFYPWASASSCLHHRTFNPIKVLFYRSTDAQGKPNTASFNPIKVLFYEYKIGGKIYTGILSILLRFYFTYRSSKNSSNP